MELVDAAYPLLQGGRRGGAGLCLSVSVTDQGARGNVPPDAGAACRRAGSTSARAAPAAAAAASAAGARAAPLPSLLPRARPPRRHPHLHRRQRGVQGRGRGGDGGRLPAQGALPSVVLAALRADGPLLSGWRAGGRLPAQGACGRCSPCSPAPGRAGAGGWVHWLAGTRPRPPLARAPQAGMERKDVMSKNVAIYKAQAAALEAGAAPGCKARAGRGRGGGGPGRQRRRGSRQPAGCVPPCLPSPSNSRTPPLAWHAGAGGGQPRQHQRPHPQGERALHPRGCAPGWLAAGRHRAARGGGSAARGWRRAVRARCAGPSSAPPPLALPHPSIPHPTTQPPPFSTAAENITCLTRLDHNRALGQLSERSGVHNTKVKNVIIWGNHSSTQVRAWGGAVLPSAWALTQADRHSAWDRPGSRAGQQRLVCQPCIVPGCLRLASPALPSIRLLPTRLLPLPLQYPDVNHATIDGKPARQVGGG